MTEKKSAISGIAEVHRERYLLKSVKKGGDVIPDLIGNPEREKILTRFPLPAFAKHTLRWAKEGRGNDSVEVHNLPP